MFSRGGRVKLKTVGPLTSRSVRCTCYKLFSTQELRQALKAEPQESNIHTCQPDPFILYLKCLILCERTVHLLPCQAFCFSLSHPQLPTKTGQQSTHNKVSTEHNKECLINISKYKFALVINGLTNILKNVNNMVSPRL